MKVTARIDGQHGREGRGGCRPAHRDFSGSGRSLTTSPYGESGLIARALQKHIAGLNKGKERHVQEVASAQRDRGRIALPPAPAVTCAMVHRACPGGTNRWLESSDTGSLIDRLTPSCLLLTPRATEACRDYPNDCLTASATACARFCALSSGDHVRENVLDCSFAVTELAGDFGASRGPERSDAGPGAPAS